MKELTTMVNIITKYNSQLQTNWGKSKCSNKLWIGALPKSCSEEYILSKTWLICPDDVTEVIYDQKYDECIVIFKTKNAAQLARTQIKSRVLAYPAEKDQPSDATFVQVDYCSDKLHHFFVDRKFGSASGTTLTPTMTYQMSSAVAPDPLHMNACRKLCVSNLDLNVTDESLWTHFGCFGHILEVDVRDRVKNSSFAFIEFTNIESAAAAIRACRTNNSPVRQDCQESCPEGSSVTSSAGSNPNANPHINLNSLSFTSELKQKPIKANWVQSKCNNKLWIGALPKSCSEEHILSSTQLICPDDVTEVIYDQKYDESIVTFKTKKAAQLVHTQIKSRVLVYPAEKGQPSDATLVQVDYCSDKLHHFFVDRKFGSASAINVLCPVSNTKVTSSSNKRKSECEPCVPSKSRKVLSSFHSTADTHSKTALTEVLRTSNQSTETKTMQQQDKRKGVLPEVELPANIPNEHIIRNIEEARVVLNDCCPSAAENFKTISGQVLYPPAITCGDNEQHRVELGEGGNMQWKIPHNHRFLFPAEFPQSWVVAIFQGCDVNAGRDFIETFVNAAQRRGICARPPKEFDMFESSDVKYIRQKFEHYKKNDVQYVLLFTKDKLDPVYHTVKLMEGEFGIITQNIPEMTMKKALSKHGAFQVIDNIVMKFNRKLGGINYGLSTSKAMSKANHFTHDVVKQEWLRESRMFIGLDMNHGEKPAIVSMAYTVGHPLKISLYYNSG